MYTTNGKIIRLGRAVCVDLSDANLPVSPGINNPHMTLLFSRQKIPDNIFNDIQIMSNTHSPFTFTLQPYGKHSDKISGELEDFFAKVGTKYPFLISIRKPHVELRCGVEPSPGATP